jgi:hypothetical protein
MATKVDEEIWATTEAALGAECAREKLDEATWERLKQAAYRCEPDVFQSLVSHGRPVLFEIAAHQRADFQLACSKCARSQKRCVVLHFGMAMTFRRVQGLEVS